MTVPVMPPTGSEPSPLAARSTTAGSIRPLVNRERREQRPIAQKIDEPRVAAGRTVHSLKRLRREYHRRLASRHPSVDDGRRTSVSPTVKSAQPVTDRHPFDPAAGDPARAGCRSGSIAEQRHHLQRDIVRQTPRAASPARSTETGSFCASSMMRSALAPSEGSVLRNSSSVPSSAPAPTPARKPSRIFLARDDAKVLKNQAESRSSSERYGLRTSDVKAFRSSDSRSVRQVVVLPVPLAPGDDGQARECAGRRAAPARARCRGTRSGRNTRGWGVRLNGFSRKP